jgi:hypothetical protein
MRAHRHRSQALEDGKGEERRQGYVISLYLLSLNRLSLRMDVDGLSCSSGGIVVARKEKKRTNYKRSGELINLLGQSAVPLTTTDELARSLSLNHILMGFGIPNT